MTLEEYFSTGPPHEKPVYEAVMAHMSQFGPVHVEPVSVGIFLKRSRTFVELRPMRNWEAISNSLPRPVTHELITRKVVHYKGRYYHVANVRDPQDLDPRLLDLLAEAFFSSPE